MNRSNLAFKSNLNYKEKFETKTQKKSSHIGRVKKKQIKAVKPLFYISLIATASLILSFYVANLAKGSTINFKITENKKLLYLEQNETIRLKSILESKCCDFTEIENYAKLNLNMRKQNKGQVHYICSSKGNKAEATKNKSEKFKKSEKFLDKLKNCFKSLG